MASITSILHREMGCWLGSWPLLFTFACKEEQSTYFRFQLQALLLDLVSSETTKWFFSEVHSSLLRKRKWEPIGRNTWLKKNWSKNWHYLKKADAKKKNLVNDLTSKYTVWCLAKQYQQGRKGSISASQHPSLLHSNHAKGAGSGRC